ncbi:MAG: Hsp20 family protein [Opitutaceae bacterium]|nr:Hsp20 family protein [Opitutaceae bacterium]
MPVRRSNDGTLQFANRAFRQKSKDTDVPTLTGGNPFRDNGVDWLPIARWSPFRKLERMQRQMVTLFERPPLRCDIGCEKATTTHEWAPLVDAAEEDKEYLVKVDLPELKEKEGKVRVENGVRTISGERKVERQAKTRSITAVNALATRLLAASTVPDFSDATKVAIENPTVRQDPAPMVRFLGFGESSLDFKLAVWTIAMAHSPTRFRSDRFFAIERKLDYESKLN